MLDLDAMALAIQNNKYNPENIFYESLRALEISGITAPNATMPLIALLEHQVTACAINNSEIDLVNRYLNPNYADTHEAIARHLDYSVLNTIHANPGVVDMTLALGVDDILTHGYLLNDGSRRVVIPTDTIIGYSDEIFYALHHAIEITALDKETIDVRYIDNDNPLMEMENPVIECQYRQVNDLANLYNTLILELTIKTYQFKREYYTYPVTSSLGFNKTYTLDDQYYHARVFSRSGVNWVEMNTYFSEFIYDAHSTKGSVVVSLKGNELTLTIPQIYFNRKLIGTEVKVVIYTTKGDIAADYNLTSPDDYSIEFKNTEVKYSRLAAPLENFKMVYVYSQDSLKSGGNIPTVDVLRESVICGDDRDSPITEPQLENKLGNLGYKLVHELNYISDNIYVASKRLTDLTLINTEVMVSGGGLDILLTDLNDKYGVLCNGSNYTVTPNLLAYFKSGIVKLLTNTEVSIFKAKPTLDQLTSLNNETYLTTPFYYLIERLAYNRLVSVFELDTPKLVARDFIGTNENNAGLISSRSIELVKSVKGYTLNVVAITNDTFLNYADESFIPQLWVKDKDAVIYTLNGIFTGRGDDGEFLYSFDLTTDYELSYLSTIILTSVRNASSSYTSGLKDIFTLTYNLISNLPENIDNVYKEFTVGSKLAGRYQTITVEELTLEFGSKLDSIYSPVREFEGVVEYQYYTEDVPAVYPEDVYETDTKGYVIFTANPAYVEGGDFPRLLYNKLHSRGEPIYKDDGVTRACSHYAGNLVLNADGTPHTVGRGNSQLQTKLMFIDYKYKYVPGYMGMIKSDILDNLNSDIKPLAARMIGLTSLKYNLSTSVGRVGVVFDAENKDLLNSELTFNVLVKVDALTYRKGTLRTLITKRIKVAIGSYIKRGTFSINELISEINTVIGKSVIGFNILSINDRTDILNFSLESPSSVVGIKAQLELGSDNLVKLTDGINVSYKMVK